MVFWNWKSDSIKLIQSGKIYSLSTISTLFASISIVVTISIFIVNKKNEEKKNHVNYVTQLTLANYAMIKDIDKNKLDKLLSDLELN